MNRCNICIEENCNGKYNCNCDKCNKINKCPRILRPTIRITNKCTQECSHCCFSSSPKSSIMMSLDMAKEISIFLKSNKIIYSNVMGGEFFCNPDWYEILKEIIKNLNYMRLVTNGDWSSNDDIKDRLLSLKFSSGNKLHISLSKDRWHTNKGIKKAIEFLEDCRIPYNVAKPEEISDRSIVPIGRSRYEYSFYSSLGSYCFKYINKYTFLIDELGEIYKCPFGVIRYDNIKNYLDGEFDKRFKEFNKRFYKLFITNCRQCLMSSKLNNIKIVSHE